MQINGLLKADGDDMKKSGKYGGGGVNLGISSFQKLFY
jgi:hypothetical protein